ncbi:MAG: hypothetical protein KJ749_08605 [Planctomycetes bacterium]|nr:hypothetical protein [Planctomycetota bacterium]
MSENGAVKTPGAPAADSGVASEQERGRWADPAVPVGNAPPQPHWPLYVFSAAWAGWLAFLVVMLVST